MNQYYTICAKTKYSLFNILPIFLIPLCVAFITAVVNISAVVVVVVVLVVVVEVDVDVPVVGGTRAGKY